MRGQDFFVLTSARRSGLLASTLDDSGELAMIN